MDANICRVPKKMRKRAYERLLGAFDFGDRVFSVARIRKFGRAFSSAISPNICAVLPWCYPGSFLVADDFAKFLIYLERAKSFICAHGII